MENITLGELADTLKWIITLITSIITIIVAFKKMLDKSMQPIHKKIDELDVHQCKNFLVRFLTDIERGQKIDEVRLIK